MSNHQDVIDLARAVTGNNNLYSVQPFIKITGDTIIGLFLERVVYWSDRSGNERLRQLKVFYKSADEWADELGLSYAQITRARKELEAMGFIQTSKRKVNNAPTLHYYANIEAIKGAIIDYYQANKNCGYANLDKVEIEESRNSENPHSEIEESRNSIEIQESSSSLNNSSNSSSNEVHPGPVCQKLLEVCRLKLSYVKRSRPLVKQLADTLEFLTEEGAQPGDIGEFGTWRKDHHWTGKDGSAPTLKQVGELWGQYQEWVTSGKNKNGYQQKVSISAK